MARRLAFMCLLMFMIMLLFPLALAESGKLEMKPFEIEEAQDNIQQDNRACGYTVWIRTSCKSSTTMNDTVSIMFGDGKGNQVRVQGLDKYPGTPPFSNCTVHKFKILGPCTKGKICYLYLKRDGTYRWNWMPAWVKVSKNNVRRNEMLLEFRYGISLPNHKWCGFNNCSRVSSGSTNATVFANGDVYRCLPPRM